MGILTWILFGLIAGIIAKLILPGKDPGGFIITTLLGIAGALLGGFIGSVLGWGTVDQFDTRSMLLATKLLLGEFDLYYAGLSSSGWTAVGTEWKNTYLPAARELYSTGIRARCNLVISPVPRSTSSILSRFQPTIPSARCPM